MIVTGLRITEVKETAAREISTAKHRAATDVSNAKLYSSQAFATDLLDVADNLDRAQESYHRTQAASVVSSSDSAQANAESLLHGVEMTQTGLLRVFERHGISRIDALHQPFDPNSHEAISSVKADDPSLTSPAVQGQRVAPGSVAAVAQEGYRLNERVLRPARVVVVAQREKDWRHCSSLRAHWASGWTGGRLAGKTQ